MLGCQGSHIDEHLALVEKCGHCGGIGGALKRYHLRFGFRARFGSVFVVVLRFVGGLIDIAGSPNMGAIGATIS
jgi:hypothetical protein